jgi:serine/threonine protein kinase
LVDVIKGKYQIVREIARSNDIVYEAMDTALGRRIALKELNIAPSLTGQARRERIERFNREARAAGRLSHPNIVSVTDFFEENGRHFIAMEYLEGQSLRDAMQVRGSYPLKEALTIAYQVLDALGYAHTHQVIHRDIKPDNIHILTGGQVKLTDFGIARLMEQPALTSDGQVFGTPSYMSPEQIEGKGIDHRSDLFSLGVLLYEMVAGRKPFVGDSVISITYAVMNADPPQLNGVPTAIEQVIRRALAKNPIYRYTTAEQMKADLQSAEQMPAQFAPPFGSQTNMGRTNPGFGYHGTGSPMVPGLPSMPGYPANGAAGQSTGYTGMASGYPPLPGASQPGGGLPWSWNTPGSAGAGVAAPVMAPQTPAGAPVPSTGVGGMSPYGAPPYPARPSEPLFVLSPGGRAFLISVLVAALLGGLIAIGVIAFLRSYDRYKTHVSTQQIATLMSQGVAAYNARDYASAVRDFEQALAANPGPQDLSAVRYNLVASYVQLARLAEAEQKWQEARDLYQRALVISPDDKLANGGMAGALQHLGDVNGARDHESTAETGTGPSSAPPKLEMRAPSTPDAGSTVDPKQFIRDREQRAQKLLDAGNELWRNRDVNGAREKWQQVVDIAPGTAQSTEAIQNLNNTSGQ